jgi:branched-chain amino acid transport system substrate-binding protein
VGFGLATFGVLLSSHSISAAKKYGPGVTDTEIKIGQFAADSGPLASFSVQNKAGIAFFDTTTDGNGLNCPRPDCPSWWPEG